MLEHERWLALVLLLPTLLSEGVRSSTRDILKNIRSLLMLVLAPLAAMIVQMAISRTREYAADNLGARISARPDALASALVKISSRSGSRAKRHCGIPIPQPLPSLSSTRCPGAAWTTCSPPIHRPRIASPRSIDCRMKWVSVALVHRGRLPQAPGPALGATALSASEGVCSVGKSNKNLVFFAPRTR
jgi:hypothetical protein